MTTWPFRKQWWGYTNIGPIQIPPNPKYLVIADRVTGTNYWVYWTGSAVALTTTLPGNPTADGPTSGRNDPGPKPYNNAVFYDAYDEPVLGQADNAHITRLVIESGTLTTAVEAYNPQQGIYSTPPIYVIPKILGFGKTYAKLGLGSGTYSVTVLTLSQTASPAPYIGTFSQQYDD